MEIRRKRGVIVARHLRAVGSVALLLIVGATIGRTSAAFTDVAAVAAAAAAGVVELDAGGTSQLTFSGADLSAIGPGATLTQSITIVNRSTVTNPSDMTDIALWADLGTTSLQSGELASALQVRITRAVGSQPSSTLYDGSLAALATNASFAAPIGSLWRSRNGTVTTGSSATQATYTVVISLPTSATDGAGSSARFSFIFEARNVTS
jgi:hypothetical protein